MTAICWLFAGCAGNQNVNLLVPGPGSWIVYPSPPRVTPLAGTPLATVFRREFVLASVPSEADLSWRCLKSGQLNLNGTVVNVESPRDWTTTTHLEAGNFLHPGTNFIVAQVSCSNAFPALNLVLKIGDMRITSDETWESSMAGAVWKPARLASKTTKASPGNSIYGAENFPDAWRRSLVLIAGFAVLAIAVVALLNQVGPKHPARIYFAIILFTVGSLTFLVFHNARLLPAWSGFDASAHLAYVQYIQEHTSLPSARQGWEMFQAPLYYLLSALLLGALHLKALEPSATSVFCLFNFALGLVGLVLILDAMRILFPGRRRSQIVGLLLAAFLPAQIYLIHYPTNEILGAVTTTASLCLCLRMLSREKPSLGQHIGLGITLAASLSSKASAFAVLPAIFLALAAKASLRRDPIVVSVQNIALTFGLCGLLGGWHYVRLWREFGSPFAGNWDPAVAGAWWQQPGFRTSGYYLTFGESLVRPYFSGFHSFWDGLYSTWWGDGCFGGATRLYGRTPWNYDLVTIGFVLALIPSALVLTGFCLAVREAVLRRRLEWVLLTAAALLLGFAVFVMSVKLPYYSESRAMYALPAILPFCAFGALGMEFYSTRYRHSRSTLSFCLGVWILVVYASFWIRPNTIQTRVSRAIGLLSADRKESGTAFEKVLELDPLNPIAVDSLAELDKDSGGITNATTRLETEARSVTNEIVWTTLALYLGEQGRATEAVDWLGRACDIAPDYPAAPALLCLLSLRSGQNDEAVRAGQLALRVAPQDYEVQFNVGLALVRLKRFPEAAAY
ncbi:MAG TPA: hypothetical protein VHZ30_00490, partial [Verrucomicrobiae bacterium]|nr:hypothetical protein [Verrucomicrobiae bacterium]